MSEAENSAELMVSARWIEALDRQATIIMAIFARAGFEPIAPPVIQPADVFLDLIGEDLRQRTYVFYDPDGAELCLRPDLTIPACRLYLARHAPVASPVGLAESEPAFGRTGQPKGKEKPQPKGHQEQPARFAYNDVVFRYQPTRGSLVRPREFRQVGIESFAASDPAKAEAEILALSVESVRAAGLRAFRLHIGDLGLFTALIAAMAMPERWRARLKHHFWRPEAFRRQLGHVVNPGEMHRELPVLMLGAITASAPEDAERLVETYIAERGLTIAGTRGTDEIAEQLQSHGQDLLAQPLPEASAALIEAYLKIECAAEAAPARIRALLAGTGIGIEPALAAYDNRLRLAAAESIDISQALFSAGFGRAFEYYTGFVFELVSPVLGDATPLGGGGRYDTLVGAISGGRDVPAVGAALHTERLLLAVRGGRP